MSIYVTGSIYEPNGLPTGMYNRTSGAGGIRLGAIEFDLRILGGHLSVDLSTYPAGFESDLDLIFVTARHLVNAVVLPRALTEGRAASFRLENCRTPDGVVHTAPIDFVPNSSMAVPPPDLDSLFHVVATHPRFYWALVDFNGALQERENCPHLFYRAVESAAKAVLNVDEMDGKTWPQLHERLGTQRAMLQPLYELRQHHAHGTHTTFTAEEHFNMRDTAWLFLTKAALALGAQPRS